jgi:8-oxo-dGTP pyrophosphatase MutT (NUDIX family)
MPQEIFKTPFFILERGLLEKRETGRAENFYRFLFPDWVNIVAVTPKQEIVTIRQYRYGVDREEVEIPGGAMFASGEDPVEAGARELLEETGYRGSKTTLIGSVSPNPALQNNLCHTVLIEDARPFANPNPDEMELIDVDLVPYPQLLDMVRDGTIRHGLVLNAIHLYQLFRGDKT